MTLAKAGYGIVSNGRKSYNIHFNTSRGKEVLQVEADSMKELKDKWIALCGRRGLYCTCIDKVEII